MATEAQYTANRLNSQKSTGPVTASGQSVSKMNALSHGLTLMDAAQLPPQAKQLLDDFDNRFRPQCQPQGELEEEAFQAYVWSMYQASRAKFYEAHAEGRLMDEDYSDAAFAHLSKMSKYRIMHERAAEKNFKFLGKLQQDRFAANQCNEVLKSLGFKDRTFAASLPVFDIRKHEFKKCNASRVVGEEVFGYPDIPIEQRIKPEQKSR